MTHLHLQPTELAELRAVLARHLGKQHEAWVVGSRVTGQRLKPHSDIDLLVVGAPLGLARRADLVDALSESDLPMAVDLIEAGLEDPGFVESLRSRGAVCVWSAGHVTSDFEFEGREVNQRLALQASGMNNCSH